MKYDRFDFEQQIMKCWNVVDEIGEVYEMFYEDQPIDNDKLAHCLLGMQEMYSARFQKLFDMFEAQLAEQHTKKCKEELEAHLETIKDKIYKSLDECTTEEWDKASASVRK